jgi:hypothetical protein
VHTQNNVPGSLSILARLALAALVSSLILAILDGCTVEVFPVE